MPRKSNAPANAAAATDAAVPAPAPKQAAKPAPAPSTAAKSGTGDIFRKPKEDKRSALTHEKIADDLVAFQRAGGKIEVLGNTQTLKSIKPPETPAAAALRKDREAASATPAE
ncbi:MAG: hypothetical protein V4673_00835 [Pseudomonadota bacterium]